METVYMICATVGGTILLVQTVLLVVGHGGGGEDAADDVPAGDHHGDAAEAAFLKVLSFKTVVAFLTFFGLGGLASLNSGLLPLPAFLLAAGAGSIALYLVAYLMSALSRLHCHGNIDLRNAKGHFGKVYLRVPAEGKGVGKVTVPIQGRLVECKATTTGPEIPTGASVRVVEARGLDTIEVISADKE